MAKKQEPENTEQTIPEETATTEPEEQVVEEKQYTQEEVDALIKEKTSGHDRKISEYSETIKRLEASREDWRPAIEALNKKTEFLAALAAEGRRPEEAEGMDASQKTDILQRFQEMSRQDEIKRISTSYEKRVRDLGLTDDDPEYHDILTAVQFGNASGDYKSAEVRLKKLEKEKKTQEPEQTEDKPRETEEERIDRLADEKVRKLMEKNKLLDNDISSASGSQGSARDKIKRFSEGDRSVSRKDYEDAIKEIS